MRAAHYGNWHPPPDLKNAKSYGSAQGIDPELHEDAQKSRLATISGSLGHGLHNSISPIPG